MLCVALLIVSIDSLSTLHPLDKARLVTHLWESLAVFEFFDALFCAGNDFDFIPLRLWSIWSLR